MNDDRNNRPVALAELLARSLRENAKHKNVGQPPPAPPQRQGLEPGPYSIGSDVWPGLSKLVEEAGEVQQVIGKLLGTGGRAQHWDGSDLRSRLVEELGDLVAAVSFFAAANSLDSKLIDERSRSKLALFESWHRSPVPVPETFPEMAKVAVARPWDYFLGGRSSVPCAVCSAPFVPEPVSFLQDDRSRPDSFLTTPQVMLAVCRSCLTLTATRCFPVAQTAVTTTVVNPTATTGTTVGCERSAFNALPDFVKELRNHSEDWIGMLVNDVQSLVEACDRDDDDHATVAARCLEWLARVPVNELSLIFARDNEKLVSLVDRARESAGRLRKRRAKRCSGCSGSVKLGNRCDCVGSRVAEATFVLDDVVRELEKLES